MTRRVLLVAAVCLLGSCNEFERLIGRLGYTYDAAQDIYVTKTNAWQRRAGYDAIVDAAAAPAGMIIDCEPIVFDRGGRKYMIELWKGQYDLCTGSEVGIYKRAASGPMKWECGDDDDMLDMSYTLRKSGAALYVRSGRHWWLTGFKPGEFSEPSELLMDVAIDFARNPDMQAPFVAALRAAGYAEVQIAGTRVSFVFDRPKTAQPPTNPVLVAETQKKNRLLVERYNALKQEVGVTDNSPGSIGKMLEKSPELLKEIIKLRR